MRKLPIDIGLIHFVGIGGIGMSGIAETLHNLDYQVQGSDISESPNVARLRNLGLRIFIGQKNENVSGCLLYTSPSPRDRTRSRMPSSA